MNVKREIHAKGNIEAEKQMLVFGGKLLNDPQLLEDIGVDGESEILLVTYLTPLFNSIFRFLFSIFNY